MTSSRLSARAPFPPTRCDPARPVKSERKTRAGTTVCKRGKGPERSVVSPFSDGMIGAVRSRKSIRARLCQGYRTRVWPALPLLRLVRRLREFARRPGVLSTSTLSFPAKRPFSRVFAGSFGHLRRQPRPVWSLSLFFWRSLASSGVRLLSTQGEQVECCLSSQHCAGVGPGLGCRRTWCHWQPGRQCGMADGR